MIFEKIQEVMSKQLAIEKDAIKMDTSLSDGLGMDSLDLFQAIIELEEVFDIQMENVEELRTVRDVVSLIERAIMQLNG